MTCNQDLILGRKVFFAISRPLPCLFELFDHVAASISDSDLTYLIRFITHAGSRLTALANCIFQPWFCLPSASVVSAERITSSALFKTSAGNAGLRVDSPCVVSVVLQIDLGLALSGFVEPSG